MDRIEGLPILALSLIDGLIRCFGGHCCWGRGPNLDEREQAAFQIELATMLIDKVCFILLKAGLDGAVLGREYHLASCFVVEFEGHSGLLGFEHNVIFAREELVANSHRVG